MTICWTICWIWRELVERIPLLTINLIDSFSIFVFIKLPEFRNSFLQNRILRYLIKNGWEIEKAKHFGWSEGKISGACQGLDLAWSAQHFRPRARLGQTVLARGFPGIFRHLPLPGDHRFHNLLNQYSVLVKYNLVRETELEFPAVTFCNINPIDYENNPDYVNLVKDLFSSRLTDQTKSQVNVSTSICDPTAVKLTQTMVELGYVDSSAFFTIDQMLLSCTFNGASCSKEDFLPLASGPNGICYTWNSGVNAKNQAVDIKTTKSPGLSSGLRLELYVGQQECQPCWVDTIGATIVVHNKSLDPLVNIEGVKLKPG